MATHCTQQDYHLIILRFDVERAPCAFHFELWHIDATLVQIDDLLVNLIGDVRIFEVRRILELNIRLEALEAHVGVYS